MYIELHARSAFSFLEGASLPEELVSTCVQLGMPAMALVDTDGVYGAPRFHLAAKKIGLKAHIGAEITCEFLTQHKAKISISDCRLPIEHTRSTAVQSTINNQPSTISCKIGNRKSPIGNPFRLPLLVASRAGYQNLCRLITKMKLRTKKGEGAVLPEELEEHAEGLICLTGGAEGPLATALQQGGMEEARRRIDQLIGIFGPGNVYVELQRHFQREEEACNRAAIVIARSLNLPLLATNGVCYATERGRELCDAFTAIRHHRTLATAGHMLARNSERYLKSPQDMQQLFADLPEALANTLELSARLEFTLNDLGYEFPRYPVPEGETMNSFLRARAWEGFRQRYGRASPDLQTRARLQIEKELKLIEKLKLAGYFLIVWDLVRYCREQNILAQGRGSAANSAVCYSLGITAVDAVSMELLFERFLSEERGEWPDIDLDLPSGDEREKVIQYVYKRYGERGAAMTANVITYRNRMAAREMGKALGFDPETLNKISAAVATWEFRDENDALDRRFRDAGLDLSHPRLRKYHELCLAVQDMPRHLGQHSGGMVICQGQLDSVVPLEPASMPGRVVVQWDKEDCADMGIIKVDLLGLGMMAVLKDSIELIRDHYREEVDLAHLPQNDAPVYSALQQADTVGMFQVESRAQMSCLPRLRPQRFYDIVVQVAIIRPGPIVGQMVNPFLQRRQGREGITYPHPSLEPVLKRTLGVPLFQEQLLRLAMIAANFTGGEAEELRRAMGFKRSQARMKEIETKLRAGMTQNKIPPKAQEEIILSITSFALYGFPESHAASFALIAYASAYLKCHYLAAFTAALLNNQPMGFYSPATIVKDAQRHGLKVLPVDVMKSEWNCTLEAVARGQGPVARGLSISDLRLPIETPQSPFNTQSAINNQQSTIRNRQSEIANSVALRMGLRYVRGLREEAAQALVCERMRAPFVSIHDLTRRVPDLRKDELTTLAEIGALNAIGKFPIADFRFPIETNPSVSPSTIKTQKPKIASTIVNRKSSIGNSFHRRDALWQVERAIRGSGPLLEQQPEPDSPSPLQPMNHEERLVVDFHGTGLTVGPHPMAYRREWLTAMGIRRASELRDLPSGKRLRIGGCVITRQRPGTAKGFVFISLEDETGVANAIITPDLFHRNRLLLASERFLAIEGILQNQDNVISVRAERVQPLFVTKAETVSHDFH
ncbi:Error-prone DNA polymerase, DnaE-like protein [Candidatus Sulfotelmatobacter kueseliae]|uniref:Error-prone DNA polymerase n=1 Tax=Candidatus Sulfotelmatobacter kueseliae TaxID=2042962 RepID=A0A2U3LEG2_9BACT|nr:Error-prone DNA polymerase, DnaE-like protein [Candidatus Sulfotelmatobacter kueseliae]